jgi:hypothetical protein
MRKIKAFCAAGFYLFLITALVYISGCSQPRNPLLDTTSPVISLLSVSPNPTAGAASVILTAAATDSTTGASNISGAEYFVDTAGQDGTGTAMSAQDGAFDGISENLSATIDITGWTAATHQLFAHAKDSSGNWCALTSVDVTKTSGGAGIKPDGTSQGIISYTVMSFSGNKPQEAVWIEDNAGNFIRTLFVSNHTASAHSTLPTWNSKSGGLTNGTSGATKNAGSFNANWACVDKNGVVVISGTYRYRIETAHEGGPGPAVCGGAISAGDIVSSSNGTAGGFISTDSAGYTP